MTKIHCEACQREIPPHSPGGMCPVCLLKGGISGQPEFQQEPTTAGARTAPSPSELGGHFPQLEILSLLGVGGMGAVYHARQIKLDRTVALKIILPESANDPSFAERFAREARTLARLDHPNIVGIHDFGEFDDGYFFLMEYVAGANLRQILQEGRLDQELALSIVRQICDALQYAHDAGVVHRDIKPENILVDKNGRVKIADFGLARLNTNADQPDARYFTLTGTNQVMGTPRYMAPEQIESASRVDQRADIYSLGVVFYEMLTGEVPMGSFEPPSQKGSVDKRIDQVVLKAMAREPARRYQQVSGLANDVSEISGVPLPGNDGIESNSRFNIDSTGSDTLESTTSWEGLSAIFDRDARAIGPWFANALNTSPEVAQKRAPIMLIILCCVIGGIATSFTWINTVFERTAPTPTVSDKAQEIASNAVDVPAMVVATPGFSDPAGAIAAMCLGLAIIALLVTPVKRQMPMGLAAILCLLSLAAVTVIIAFPSLVYVTSGVKEFQFASRQFAPAYWVSLSSAVGLLMTGVIGVRYGIVARSARSLSDSPVRSVGEASDERTVGGLDVVTISTDDILNDKLPGLCLHCGDQFTTLVNHTFEWQPQFFDELQEKKSLLGALSKRKFRLSYPVCKKHEGHRTRYVLFCSLGWIAPIVTGMLGHAIASFGFDLEDEELAITFFACFLIPLTIYIVLIVRWSFRQPRVVRIEPANITLERISWKFAKAMRKNSSAKQNDLK